MSISMYSASVPVISRLLNNMLGWLDKADEHAKNKKFEPSVYLGMRLAPDMFTLTRQVQITSDSAKGCVARLAGVEMPKWEDNEASLDDLRARIRKTIDYVQSFTPAQLDGTEEREILVPRRTGEPNRFEGEVFLKHYAMANVYFHATTTYALLRHAGVDLGKSDFLGPLK